MNDLNETTLTPSRRSLGGRTDAPGFSLVELLVVAVVFLSVMGIAFKFFVGASEHVAAENSSLPAQQEGRLALDEATRLLQQAGFGVSRRDPFNPAGWQSSFVYAGPHAAAFNSDLEDGVGALDISQTITLPHGVTYTGEIGGPSTRGAETHILTLDADGDGEITLDDREDAETGLFNPAAYTETTRDFALFHRVHGWNGTDYESTPQPIAGHLFTEAVEDDSLYFGDGSPGRPLFTYWLIEDINSDGILQDAECVVGTCPPTTAREPQLYLWGDSDFDGVLSTEEIEALRTLHVGSESWEKNPFLSGGSYLSTTTTANIEATGNTFTADVSSSTGFTAGMHVLVGSGSAAEPMQIEAVSTSGNTLAMTSEFDFSHATNSTITVLPSSLMEAIRAVEVRFDAITQESEERGPGRSGHKGTKGLTQRVRPFVRTVELVNLQTAARMRLSTASSSLPECPVTIAPICGGAAQDDLTYYVPNDTPIVVAMQAKDSAGGVLEGLTITFANAHEALGTLTETEAITDSAGIAMVQYVATGASGTDTISATTKCLDIDGLESLSDAGELEINLVQLAVNASPVCLSTIKNGAFPEQPQSHVNISVSDANGPIANEALSLSLSFAPPGDPEAPSDFTKMRGEMLINGEWVGSTSASDGRFTPVTAHTDDYGSLNATVALEVDTDQTGIRMFLTVQGLSADCEVVGAASTTPIDFYRLKLESEPVAGCTEDLPCSIQKDAEPPYAVATLTRNGIPQADVTMNFWATKTLGPDNVVPFMIPRSGIVATDENGEARIQVLHEDDSISPTNPFACTVDVQTGGPEEFCGVGGYPIGHLEPSLEYIFLGPLYKAPDCLVDIPQEGVSWPRDDEICVNILNVGECPVNIIGMGVTVYEEDGTTLADEFEVKDLKGGVAVLVPECEKDGEETLFKDKCKNPKAKLANGEVWTFVANDDCDLPPTPDNPFQPSEYFRLNKIKFNDDITFNTGETDHRRVDIRVNYQCTDECADSDPMSSLFSVEIR